MPKEHILIERYAKTKMCPFLPHNKCKKGEKCKYAHKESELRPMPNLAKTKMCPRAKTGDCDDPRCNFAHDAEELRATSDLYKTALCPRWQEGLCSNEQCRYAHGEHELRPKPSIADSTQRMLNDISKTTSSSSSSSSGSTTASSTASLRINFGEGNRATSICADTSGASTPLQNNIHNLTLSRGEDIDDSTPLSIMRRNNLGGGSRFFPEPLQYGRFGQLGILSHAKPSTVVSEVSTRVSTPLIAGGAPPPGFEDVVVDVKYSLGNSTENSQPNSCGDDDGSLYLLPSFLRPNARRCSALFCDSSATKNISNIVQSCM